MFMKHYAPNRCEPRIKVIVKMGIRLGRGGGVDVNEELVILGGGGGGGGLDVNKQLKGSYCKNAIKKSWWGVLVLTGAQGGCE